MPDVVGQIRAPDGSRAVTRTVKFSLVDAVGMPVEQAFDADDTLVGSVSRALDVDGNYSVTLPGNADISPSGTRWLRTLVPPSYATAGAVTVRSSLIVPTAGGPYFEEGLLALPLEPLPEAEPSNEVDSVERTTNYGPVTGGVLAAIPIPGMVVEVPDIDRPCYIEGKGMMRVANVDCPAIATLGIGPVSESQITFTALFDISTLSLSKVGDLPVDNTGRASIRVAASTPGEYQLYMMAHNNVGPVFPASRAVTIIAAAHVKAFLRVMAV